MRFVLIEKEDVLKAGHCVEPDKEMQDCAEAIGAEDASMEKAITAWYNFRDFLRGRSEPLAVANPSAIPTCFSQR